MNGTRLNNFCEALCRAIARGAWQFEFEGKKYGTTEAQKLADSWLLAAGR